MTGETVHPRPQLARRHWVNLCGTWGFAYDDANRGRQEGWEARVDVFTRTIRVPFPPESPASGVGDTGFHPIVWYRRTFSRPTLAPGQRLILHCGAIDYRSQVWVNGRLVAEHEGGQTPFRADISDALSPGGEQALVIRAEDWPTDLAQPRGKQDWLAEPHRIWYHRTTGIWQPVWLEPVGAIHIAELGWTPDLDRGTLRVRVVLNRSVGPEIRVRIRLSMRGAPLADDTVAAHGLELYREIALDVGGTTMNRDEVLWFPETPNLVDAHVSVLDGDQEVDEVESYAGLRSVGATGGRFLLNGRPYYLRLVLAQGYWPESHLAAPSPEALRREVELAKQLGFNGVRIHQKVEDPRFLYWCDRLGLMVWGEMANAYVFSPDSARRLTREWLDVLARDGSHPCIVAWVPINESWGVPNLPRDPAQRDFVRSLYHLTRSLDPTRPVVANDGWEYLVGDVFGIHDYAKSGEVLGERYGSSAAVERTLREVQPGFHFATLAGVREEGVPIVISEFGGIHYPEAPASMAAAGYGSAGSSEELYDKYRELVEAVLDCPTTAGFCYTQLTDTAQERNGLLDEHRVPKIDPGGVARITRRPSAALAADVVAQLRKVTPAPFGGSGPEP